jgi:protein SERAC1
MPLWPQNILAGDISKARIVTFGYDADVVRLISAASSNTLRDHGKALATDLARKRSVDECVRLLYVVR